MTIHRSSKREACLWHGKLSNCFPESARLEGPDIISDGRPNSLSSNLLKRPPSKQAIIQARFPRENRAGRDSKHRYIWRGQSFPPPPRCKTAKRKLSYLRKRAKVKEWRIFLLFLLFSSNSSAAAGDLVCGYTSKCLAQLSRKWGKSVRGRRSFDSTVHTRTQNCCTVLNDLSASPN